MPTNEQGHNGSISGAATKTALYWLSISVLNWLTTLHTSTVLCTTCKVYCACTQDLIWRIKCHINQSINEKKLVWP